MSVPNPNNGYVPEVGEKVRVVGACHTSLLGKIVEVTSVYKFNDIWFFEEKHYDEHIGKIVYSGGLLGGLEKL